MKALIKLQQDVQLIQKHLYGEVIFTPDTEHHCQQLLIEYKERYGVIV